MDHGEQYRTLFGYSHFNNTRNKGADSWSFGFEIGRYSHPRYVSWLLPNFQIFQLDIECDKTVFFTHKEAQQRAIDINKGNRSKGDATELREYKCPGCGFFHLTSMTKHTYKKTTDREYRNRIREEVFIKRESEYWNKKFGVQED